MKISNDALAKLGFKGPGLTSDRAAAPQPSGEVERLRALVAQLTEELDLERYKRQKLAAIVRPMVEKLKARAAQAQQVPQGRAYNPSDLGAPPPTGTARNPEVLPPEGARPPRKERKSSGRPDPMRAIIEEDDAADEVGADDDIEEMLDG